MARDSVVVCGMSLTVRLCVGYFKRFDVCSFWLLPYKPIRRYSMKKELVLASFVALLPVCASADNVGGCGWGSKLFHGQGGIVPQVLAVTTNGTSGNQTFGISSGTSGCTQDGVVQTNWKTAAFIEGNKNKLARDMSSGSGEAMESLAALIGVDAQDKAAFFAAAKANYSRIVPTLSVSSDEVKSSLRSVLSESAELAKYSANV